MQTFNSRIRLLRISCKFLCILSGSKTIQWHAFSFARGPGAARLGKWLINTDNSTKAFGSDRAGLPPNNQIVPAFSARRGTLLLIGYRIVAAVSSSDWDFKSRSGTFSMDENLKSDGRVESWAEGWGGGRERDRVKYFEVWIDLTLATRRSKATLHCRDLPDYRLVCRLATEESGTRRPFHGWWFREYD